MYKRHITDELEEAFHNYPVITVLGSRQSGKTTLVRSTFPKKPYVNLEAPDMREFASADPRGFLAKYPEGLIIDEIQNVPILLSYIQVIVDEKKVNGMFLLIDSFQMAMHEKVSQSLAGRTAILELLPMSLAELAESNSALSLNEAMFAGGYPGIFEKNLNPTKTYRYYYQTYLERDLRQIIHIKDLSQFQKFIKVCASRVGGLLNLEGIGNEVGISSHTVKNWLSILEASFVIIRLQPYFENFGKRVIKASKLYFTDVGLLCYILGIENAAQLDRDPLRGYLVENLVILEVIKHRLNQGFDPHLYYYRDAQGHEVDLLFQSGSTLIPIEIKAGETFHRDFLKNLLFFQKLVGERASRGILVYTGDKEQKVGSIDVVSYTKVIEKLFPKSWN